MLSTLRTYRVLAASVVVLLVTSMALPLLHHACAMGLMEMEQRDCCHDDAMAMPEPKSDCHGEMPAESEPAPVDARMDCCTVEVAPGTTSLPLLPASHEAPVILAAPSHTVVPARSHVAVLGPSPPLPGAPPPGLPPAHILYGTFLN